METWFIPISGPPSVLDSSAGWEVGLASNLFQGWLRIPPFLRCCNTRWVPPQNWPEGAKNFEAKEPRGSHDFRGLLTSHSSGSSDGVEFLLLITVLLAASTVIEIIVYASKCFWLTKVIRLHMPLFSLGDHRALSEPLSPGIGAF